MADPVKQDPEWETISPGESDWETVSKTDIPSPSLDTFKGENYLPPSMPIKRHEVSGVPPRGLSIDARQEPIQFPTGFRGSQEHIGAEVKPEIKPRYGYGSEWDNLGTGAGIPPTGEETPSPYAVNLLQKLKEFHEAPPLVPGIDKFLGSAVDPYQPGFGQTTGAKIIGVVLRGVGKLASGLTTPENLLIAAAFEGAGLGAANAAGEKEALRAAPKVAPLLKAGEKVNLLEVPGLQRIARRYVEGQVIKEFNKALQTGAAGYFGAKSAEQVANAETPEDVVAGVLGTGLAGLGVYHGAKGLYSKGIETPEIAPEPTAVPLDSNKKIILPEGWTAEVGKVDKDFPAMRQGNKLIFASQEAMDNPSVWNHEVVHAVLNNLPEKAKANFTEQYINQKQSDPKWQKLGKDYMVMNNFHKEDMAIDLGNYFTHPEFVSPGVKKLFDLWFPKNKGVETPVSEVTPTETTEFHHGLLPNSKTESITVYGKDVKSIDVAVSAREKEGYTAIDVSPDGGIIMSGAKKPTLYRDQSTRVFTPRTIHDKIRQALQDATEGAEEQADINKSVRAQKFAKARKVTATGEEGARQVFAAMRGKHGRATMEPLKLEQTDVDELIDTIRAATRGDIPAQLQSLTTLQKMRTGEVPTPSEREAFKETTGIDLDEFYHGESGAEGIPKVDIRRPSIISELVNLPRTIQASIDLSAPFRQGMGLIHNKAWWTNWYTMVRAMGSEEYYRGVIDDIQSRVEFQQMRDATGHIQKSIATKAGLKLTDLTDMTKREESMMSTWAERIPVAGRGIRASNRAYVAFLDKLRADVFSSLIKDAAKTGLDPTHNDILLKKIGDYVNNTSGRGALPKGLEQAAVALNGLFFSPRLIASRIQMLNPKNYMFQPAFIRRQYLKSALGIATAWLTFAGLMKASGAQVSFDPDNADFMKVRFGNTRFDLGGGFQQYLVLAHRLYSGKYVSSSTGRGYEMGQAFGKKSRADAILDFVHNKMAPVPNTVWNAAAATKYSPFQVGDTAAKMFTPMFIQDLISITKDDPSNLWLAPLSGIGGGAQTYPKRGLGYTWVPPKNDILIPSNARVR